jgi:monooxygenase
VSVDVSAAPTGTGSAVAGPPTGTPEPEHVDVLVIGAGLSGIGAACRLRIECPWATFAVLEARADLGGTWDLFRYPGIRSDSDMFTLGYPFRPWPGGESIADGPAILQYLRDTAADYGIDRHIRFRHRVVAADLDTATGRWDVVIERAIDDVGVERDADDVGVERDADDVGVERGADDVGVERVRLTCNWIMSCTGYYRYDRGYLPDFAGMDEFGGTIVHPQFWPEDLDHDGARVVVIGSGATAITLVPALADRAAHVTMLQRSPTYVASLPRTNPLTSRLRRLLPRRWEGPVLRWTNALTTQGFYLFSRRRPDVVKRLLRKGVERELPAGYDVDAHFTPRYDPWDQRLCVVTDGDLFAGIRNGSVEVVTDHVERFTEDGILLRSGRHLPADVVVTATGLDLLFLGGIELSVDGEAVDVTERMAYKGMMLEGVPNLAMAVGYTNASWTLKSDLTCRYVCRLLNHLRRSGSVTCTPVAEGVEVSEDSLMGLSSGYVVRARDRIPRQGDRFPWRVYQSYVQDLRAMRHDGLGEGLRFDGPQLGDGVAGSAARRSTTRHPATEVDSSAVPVGR